MLLNKNKNRVVFPCTKGVVYYCMHVWFITLHWPRVSPVAHQYNSPNKLVWGGPLLFFKLLGEMLEQIINNLSQYMRPMCQ